jgi:hypothetical protein
LQAFVFLSCEAGIGAATIRLFHSWLGYGHIGIVCKSVLPYVAEGRISFDMLRVDSRMDGFVRFRVTLHPIVVRYNSLSMAFRAYEALTVC